MDFFHGRWFRFARDFAGVQRLRACGKTHPVDDTLRARPDCAHVLDSRDQRPDCAQLVIAIVVTPEGFPLTYEIFAGDRADVTTLEEMLEHVEAKHGQARRIWIFDRGIVSEANLQRLRARGGQYVVGTPRH